MVIHALLRLNEREFLPDIRHYSLAISFLDDDFEKVRLSAMDLVRSVSHHLNA